MKKAAFFFVLFFVFDFSLFAQNANPATIQTQHYLITIEPGAERAADTLALELELRFAVFNTLFRFDVSALTEPLRARVFADEAAYNSYIETRAGMKREGALYLHYSRRENRELAVCRSSAEPSQLAHQAFVQFLRGFIANPPAWMLEGFAIYFSTLEFDPGTGDLSYEENLSWLPEARRIAIPLMQVFESASPPGDPALQDFQVRSWALVSFFLISGLEEYYRTLTECFMLLSPDGSAEANSRAVIRHIGDWDNFDLMDDHFRLYLNARKTFDEHIEEGRSAYLSGDADRARLNFISALDQKADHYAPYYFLALIYQNEKEYEVADELYQMSLGYGADEALVFYALGINAASAGKKGDAVNWLRRASAADQARFGQRSEELLRRVQ